MDKDRSVSLGCGTLILIALIVIIFAGGGTQEVKTEVEALRKEVAELRMMMERQTKTLESMEKTVLERHAQETPSPPP